MQRWEAACWAGSRGRGCAERRWHGSTTMARLYQVAQLLYQPAAQGRPRRTASLSRILPANKNSIRADPSKTAAKAGVRNSLRDKTVCLLRQH